MDIFQHEQLTGSLHHHGAHNELDHGAEEAGGEGHRQAPDIAPDEVPLAFTTTIGFKLNWEQLVASKGLRYRGYRLLWAGDANGPAADSHPEPAAPSPAPAVAGAPSPVGGETPARRPPFLADPHTSHARGGACRRPG
jgi:hypothetical protein